MFRHVLGACVHCDRRGLTRYAGGVVRLSRSAVVLEGKLSVEHLKAVRSKTGLSISLCRNALLATNNSVPDALKWLDANEEARAE